MATRQYYILPILATVGCSGMTVLGVSLDETAGGTALPLASAGADREILRGFPALLDGTATMHTADEPISFAWVQTAGVPVYLSSPSEPAPSFVAPLDEQTLTFRLTVTDGFWSTADHVSLHVRARPTQSAPLLVAGADRVLDYNEDPEPNADDLPRGLQPDVEATWEHIEPTRLARAATKVMAPAVFRLTGTRSGLSSAPDYLLLYPYGTADSPNAAPTAALDGPTLLEPNESFRLDASRSSDPNNDAVHLRWVQTQGEPLLPAAGSSNARLDLHAPARPQRLGFRVYARDSVLESAAAELTIEVSATNEAPRVQPGPDQRTRPGRTVQLDARSDTPKGTQQQAAAMYVWQQTLGTPVELAQDTDGRITSFDAPAAPNELAFAVVATLAGVESAPAVTCVTVVEELDNLPPAIDLAAGSTTPIGGALVELSATVMDPEGDPLSSCTWVQEPPDAVDLPVCEAATLFAANGDMTLDVTAPAAGSTVTITLAACDDRDACDEASIQLDPQ